MKQKIILLAITFISMSLRSTFSQIITEDVLFNNYNSSSDNDLVNRFTGGLGLTQITTNGITGGCLTTPNTVSWGNDNAIYCSKYIAASTYYAKTGLYFKYDTTQINTVNFDRAVSIFLRPGADFNHYVIASVNYDKRIQIVSYAWANNPPLLNLLQDHWYALTLTATFTGGLPGDEIDLVAAVDDYGLTGLSMPVTVNTSIGTINDSILFGDSAIQVSFTASAWGGAKYIDNFIFNGIKSPDSCITFPTQIFEPSDEGI
ncbi:MAG: hypothetical protein JJE25_06325, partial [Bacteroidia bacterium]|nr:hypothetical protein [Bacteroidia bacterium]